MNTYRIDFFYFDRYSPEQLGEMVDAAIGDPSDWPIPPKFVVAAYAHLLRGIGPYKIPVHGLAEPLHVRYTPTGLLVALRAPDLALPQFMIAVSQVLLVCEQTIEQRTAQSVANCCVRFALGERPQLVE